MHDVGRPGFLCQPGDITVTPITRGFMVARVLRRTIDGPWWTYIATLADRQMAIHLAQRFAAAGHVRAWFHQTDDTYRHIPVGLPD